MSAQRKPKPPRKPAAKGAALTIAGHPRATLRIRQAKGWGGLLGFVLAALLSVRAGTPLLDAGMRALACGIVGYAVAWAAAVQIWRHLVVAELRALEGHLRAKAAAAQPDPAAR
jgi:hypothetical protein